MAHLKKHELRAYVTQAEYKRMERESVARNASLSNTVKSCLLEYLNLKEELATTLTDSGTLGDEQSGKIIHTLLMRTEERVAATIERLEERISYVSDQVNLLTAMVDRMYLGIMAHLPELPPELNESAGASSKRRHKKWLEATEKMLVVRERN